MSELGAGRGGAHGKWVEVEVSGNASEEAAGEHCTTYYSLGPSAAVTITNILGKKTKVPLKKDGARVTVCEDTQVATIT